MVGKVVELLRNADFTRDSGFAKLRNLSRFGIGAVLEKIFFVSENYIWIFHTYNGIL